ncbi:MAG TPA: cytoplasmic protein [Nitrospiraceae bacterium]|nr:cytoplasmic protein [Nitrospiraceae bacterium]
MPSKNNKKEPDISRRQFLLKTAVTCGLAGTAGVWGYVFYSKEPVRRSDRRIFTFKDFRIEEKKVYPELAVVHGRDAEKMVRTAIEKIGGISRFVSPGDKVLLKPNVAWDRQPEQAANTNPAVVAAVVNLCLEARAAEVWVTDVPVNDPYRCFARSGIEDAVKRAGGKIRVTTETDFVLTDLKGEALKVWPVSVFYHQADKLINLPVVKHHSLSKCTMAMKNLYGSLGGQRNRLHQDINTSIADLACAIRPTLTVMDATRVLKRNGPTGGNLSDVSIENTVIAGVDMVAIESYGLRFLDLKVEDIPFILMAEKRGMGISDWKSLNIAEMNV